MRRFINTATVAVVIGALALATVSAAEPAGATGFSGSCVAVGSSPVSFGPGSFFAPRPANYTYTTYDNACVLPDPSIHSGIEYGRATGTVDCIEMGGSFTGQFTVVWDNGRSSTADYVEDVVEGVNHSHGVFVAGEFTGMTFRHAGVDIALNAPVCLASRGTLQVVYTGGYSYSAT